VPCSRRIRCDAEPYWALKAQHAFEEEPDWPVQYGYAVKRRAK